MYRFLEYENLKGTVIAEKDGVLLKAFHKCIIFYTSEAFIRVSVGRCTEFRRIRLITDSEKATILELVETYFPTLRSKVEAVLAKRDRTFTPKEKKLSPIMQLLQKSEKININGQVKEESVILE